MVRTSRSLTIPDTQRLFAAFPKSVGYFTSSREIAAAVKKSLPRLIASTGGPNTMVTERGRRLSAVGN